MNTEEEQLEALKRFWKDYGMSIMVGVLLAAGVFMGWRFWESSRLESATRAATVYQDMLGAAQRSQLNPEDKAANTDVQRFGKTLKDEYAGTPFAANAGLLLARQASDRNDFKEAEKQLRWVLEQKPAEAVRLLATTRLARVLMAQKQPDAALALLAPEKAPGFAPTIEELKGDIYVSQGKVAEARTAYEAAARALLERKERRPLLEMKMADVGLAPLEEPRKDGDKAPAESTMESNPS